MQAAELKDWYIRDWQLYGIVSGHPTLEDGTTIATSKIMDINYATKTVDTQNTRYSLGQIHPRYYDFASNDMELAMMEWLFGGTGHCAKN